MSSGRPKRRRHTNEGNDHEHHPLAEQLAQVSSDRKRTWSHERPRTERPRHRPQRHPSRCTYSCRHLIPLRSTRCGAYRTAKKGLELRLRAFFFFGKSLPPTAQSYPPKNNAPSPNRCKNMRHIAQTHGSRLKSALHITALHMYIQINSRERSELSLRNRV